MTASPPPKPSTASQPDSVLLRGWAHLRSEDAFRTLVERHYALVAATARRCTGHAGLAEEAVQAVFTILARKAGSLISAPLAPWLHRTTLLECRSLLRRESRHQRRTTALAAAVGSSVQQESGGGTWQDALPVLDEAMNRLGDAERRVLLLRFFEDLSFREIAGRTGKSEAAVQRQGHRALERLGVLLRRRGVALSGAVLACGPGAAHTATAAEAAGVIASVLSGAGSQPGAAALFLNTLHTMSQTKVALTTAAAVVLLAAIPLGLQWRENGRLALSLAESEQRFAAQDRRLAALENRTRPPTASATIPTTPAATVSAAVPPPPAESGTDLLMGAGEKDIAARLTARLAQLREHLKLRADQEPALQKAAAARSATLLAAFERIRQNKATPPDMGLLAEWMLGAMPLDLDAVLDAGQSAAWREFQSAERTGRIESMTNMELVEIQSQGALHLTPEQKDAAFAALSAIIADEDAAGPAYYADDGQFTARVHASLQRRREAMQSVLNAAQQAEYSRMLDEDAVQVLTMFPPSRSEGP